PEAVSFVSKNRLSLDKTSHDFELVFMPRGYFASRSRLLKSGLGTKLSSVPINGSFIRTGVESRFKIDKSSVALGVNADIYDMVSREINCFLRVKLYDLLIGYNWKNTGFAMDSIYHNFNCRYSYVLNKFISFETEQYLSLKYQEQLAYHGELGSEFTFPVQLSIKPFIRLGTDKNTKLEKRMGLKQIFTPFERIYTELVLENTFWEMTNGHIEVKAWFLF
ncbi:MAG: hypothetical protein Q4F84_04235, partial [Fibrobacter sp.]|nr:hypothetical protein [Fibrobacter sp.]